MAAGDTSADRPSAVTVLRGLWGRSITFQVLLSSYSVCR